MVPGAKVTEEIAAIRGVPVGEDCISPPYHREFSDVDGLIDLVERIAGATGLPGGHQGRSGRAAVLGRPRGPMADQGEAPDFVTIDGGEGGSGRRRWCSPTTSRCRSDRLPRVYRTFAAAGLADDVVFIGSGQAHLPGTGLMAMALGCDLVNVGREAMLAIGCIQAQRCHTGRCPTGVATQVPWLVRPRPDLKSVRCANHVVALRRGSCAWPGPAGSPTPATSTLDHLEFVEDPTASPLRPGALRPLSRVGCPHRPPDVPVLVRTGAPLTSPAPAGERRKPCPTPRPPTAAGHGERSGGRARPGAIEGPLVDVAGETLPLPELVARYEAARGELGRLRKEEKGGAPAPPGEQLKPFQVELLKLQRYLERPPPDDRALRGP